MRPTVASGGTIHGSGIATQTALGLLRNYAARGDVSPKQAAHIRFCITQAEREFRVLRDQRDHARDVACRAEAALAELRATLS